MATSRRMVVDEAGGLSPCHLRALPQQGVVHRRDQLIQVLVQPQDVEILHVRVWVVEVVAVSEQRRGGVVVWWCIVCVVLWSVWCVVVWCELCGMWCVRHCLAEFSIEQTATRLPFCLVRMSAGMKSLSPDTNTATSNAPGTVA